MHHCKSGSFKRVGEGEEPNLSKKGGKSGRGSIMLYCINNKSEIVGVVLFDMMFLSLFCYLFVCLLSFSGGMGGTRNKLQWLNRLSFTFDINYIILQFNVSCQRIRIYIKRKHKAHRNKSLRFMITYSN